MKQAKTCTCTEDRKVSDHAFVCKDYRFLPLSTVLLLDFRIVQDSVLFFLFFILLQKSYQIQLTSYIDIIKNTFYYFEKNDLT